MITPDFTYELSLIPPGTRYLLGIDEVGRGPLAGPVSVGAFLLDLSTFDPQTYINLKIRDSKTLSASQRQTILNYFQLSNCRFSVYSADSQEIDSQGISVVINNLFSQALNCYQNQFDFALIDGCTPPPFLKGGVRGRFLPHADSRCFSVAAASIVAKVDRDRQMDEYDRLYPQYGFSHHRGYGTAAHLAALSSFGPCPIHRLSFRPCANLLPNNLFSI